MAGGFEHHFRRTIPGDIDYVRGRLSDVLESFGYVVLGDAPIQAKRPRQKSIWVSMVLDYDTTLTIALKPISSASTLATFDYSIEQLSQGRDAGTRARGRGDHRAGDQHSR